jgi:hypothetical protein
VSNHPPGRLYQSSVLTSGSYQQSGLSNSVAESRYAFRLDFTYRNKDDSTLNGILDWGLNGRISFEGGNGSVWRKSEDEWCAQASWSKQSAKICSKILLWQFKTALINEYEHESKRLISGSMIPATIHLAYGWKLQSIDDGWQIDLLPADFRWKSSLDNNHNQLVRYAEWGAFMRFQLRRLVQPRLLVSIDFEAEFSNSNVNGYEFRFFGRVDWEVWKLIRLSLLTNADQDRFNDRSRWSGEVTLGVGLYRAP